MSDQDQHLQSIEDIKTLMNKSSRFISLSGWSGVSAGVCALIAAVYTGNKIECWKRGDCVADRYAYDGTSGMDLLLIKIALITFLAAAILAFLFTYLRSKKTGVAIWGYTARKVVINVAVPMIVGGLLIFRMMEMNFYTLIAPACLLFYGLGLINASKYTLSEIRYMGYCELILGIINLWMIGYGLYFWAIGFGLLHIIYGIVMWNRYERNQ